jgi:hypothetical protein
MIEKYGKFTAMDGTEFPYTDFRASRKEAATKAEAHDSRILAAREKQNGQPLTIRESLEPDSQQKTRRSEPIADAGAKTETPAAETAGIKLPPLSAPARSLTPGEQSAKQTFMEMHLAAARAQQAKEAQQAKDSPSSS